MLTLGQHPREHRVGIPEFKYVGNMHGNEVRHTLTQIPSTQTSRSIFITLGNHCGQFYAVANKVLFLYIMEARERYGKCHQPKVNRARLPCPSSFKGVLHLHWVGCVCVCRLTEYECVFCFGVYLMEEV